MYIFECSARTYVAAGVFIAGVTLMAGVSLKAAAVKDEQLVEAAALQRFDEVRRLLADGIDVNSRRADGATALLWAAYWDEGRTVDLLIERGADVDLADDHGVTPLALACENASTAVAGRLLRAGANPNAGQTNGLTPLMIAAKTGSVEIVRTLLAAKARVNVRTLATKETALMWAVREQHRDVASLLLAAGADVNPAPGQVFSPLMRAARNGDIETAKALISAGARVNDGGADGTNPLVYSILSGQAPFATFLLEQGADPNGAIDGVTALHAASGSFDMLLRGWTRTHRGPTPGLKVSDRIGVVKALLAKGANPNSRATKSEMLSQQGFLRNGAFDNFSTGTGDAAGATPLYMAAYSMNGGGGAMGTVAANIVTSSAEVMHALLDAGADPHITANDGTTTLMVAAGCGRWNYNPGKPQADPRPTADEAVKILVEAGINVNAVNEADFTALHCAAFSGLNSIVTYLVAHGADLNARDWRGRTPYRIAEGAKQSFQFQDWAETAALLKSLGARASLGIPGTVHERLRVVAEQ